MKKTPKRGPFPLWMKAETQNPNGKKPRMPSWRKGDSNKTGQKGSFGHAPSETNRGKSIKARRKKN